MPQHRQYAALVALLALASAVQTKAQTSHEEAVYLFPEVRAQLKAAWDTVHPAQPERGYCLVSEETRRPDGAVVHVVTKALRSVAWDDDAYGLNFGCGRKKPTLHVHPPATCSVREDSTGTAVIWSSCRFGGADAYNCEPSPEDQHSLDVSGAPFALIQCDDEAFTVVYPRKAVAAGTP